VDEEALRDGIIELIACLPVYRTYIDGGDGQVPEEDVKVLEHAFTRARERGIASADALDLLSDVLRPAGPVDDPADRAARQLFIRRFQQTSGPATAKGVEDTGLYLYMPLVSRNEVGGSPDRRLEVAVPTLHEANEIRARHWPRNLVCSNTHDTKRSADVRARLDVLAAMPNQWLQGVRRWRMLNKASRVSIGRRSAPDFNTEYLFYQTLLGVWPHECEEGEYPKGDEMEALHKRVEAYMLKAVKEGKSRSSWTDPDEKFEAALKNFIHTTIFRSPTFLTDFAQIATRTTRPGFWNALTRTMLHLTVPGVPDIYQGGELFNFALVDPDNRRPVDYGTRREMLDELASRAIEDEALIGRLIAHPSTGGAKMHVFRTVLRARRENFELFAEGDYVRLPAEGTESRHVISFARTHADAAAIVVVPRLPASLTGGEVAPISAGVWGDTAVSLPPALAGRTWTCAITGRSVRAGGERGLAVGEILATFPVALLVANHRG
jgi:(1->4)-alpha-D-glucan 1-alpha-D-glucosylmutase